MSKLKSDTEIIYDCLEHATWLSPEQRERVRARIYGVGTSTTPEGVHMRESAIRATFQKAQNEIEYLQKELKRQKDRILNTPEMADFELGQKIEAAHQEGRWGDQKEAPPHHFIMVFTKLLGKLSMAIWDKDVTKFKHHLITISAVCFNTHKKIEQEDTAINEWFYKLKK